jgi:IS30 family transposase
MLHTSLLEDAMTKSDRNGGKHWTPEELARLQELARQNTPTRVIGLKLGRTPSAVSSKASQEKISLKPVNQSPYSRRNK